MNIFEQASRMKLRFPSIKGQLTVEQLWDLPLQSKTGFDLDTLAKSVNADLKGVTEESFVSSSSSPAKAGFELQLDILKHIIGVILQENEAARNESARKAEKNKLLGILADKQDEALKALTSEQIAERIKQLG